MHAQSSTRWSRILTVFIPILGLAGCFGEGDGPTRIFGVAATPLLPGQEDPCAGIATFENGCPGAPSIENFAGGASDPVANPDKRGINTSDTVVRMKKYADQVFGGTKLNLEAPLNFENGEAITMKVWSPRLVPVSFKLEETGNPPGGRTLVLDHSGSGSWEELCFDFTGQTASIPNPPVLAVTIIFDGTRQGGAIPPEDGNDRIDDGWTFYYDDIRQVASCEGISFGAPIDPEVVLYPDGDADLVLGADYDERTPFDSASVIDPDYAEDGTYSPVLSVFSGINTVSGDIIAQVGYIGFAAGFAGAYETLNFKVKSIPPGMPDPEMPNIGMPNFVIFVKLFDGVDTLRINLTSSAFSAALADDWFQVSIPISRFSGVDQATGIVFESDDSAAMQFHMLLTDIGFSGTGTGGPTGADPGIIPEAVVYASDPSVVEDLAPPMTSDFGTGATFNGAFAGDDDFNPAYEVTSGANNQGFVAFFDYPAGFAAGYETFSFKVKGLPGDTIEVKFFQPDLSIVYSVTDPAVSTDLGNGWYQMVIPLSAYSANINDFGGFLLGPLGFQDAPFTFLLTDIGFNGTAGGGADPGIIPEAVVYASDPSVVEDLAPPMTSDFGTGATFNGAFAGDDDFNPAYEVTSGANNQGFVAFFDYPAGFAAGYETFSFKVKGLPGDTIEVKFFQPDLSIVYSVTDPAVSTDLGNGWYQMVIPLSAYSANINDFGGFLLGPLGFQDAPFTFLLTDIGFNGTADGGGGDPSGNIVINGGFETGLFNDGSPDASWQQALGAETQAIVTENPSSGIYAANLNVPVRVEGDPPYDTVIKNANLQAGLLTAGASVTVTWDMRGSLAGAGGTIFVELFSERDGGGTNKAEIYTGDPLEPTADWSPYIWMTSVASSAEGGAPGGLTLQLKASCGPVVGCGVDAYFDNVTIVITSP